MIESPIQRFYRKQARFYDATRWMMLRGRKDAVAKLGLRPDGSVLEVGCGTGSNFRHLLTRLDPARGRLTGLDFSEPMLDRARRRVSRNGWTNVTLIHADATDARFPEPFDGILFAYSLLMIPDWQTALRNARDHLRPGGRVVVLDFGTFSGWGPFGRLMRAWMERHGVHTTRPYEIALRQNFETVEIQRWWGDYGFVATAS